MTPRPLPAIRGQSAPAVLRRGGTSDRTSLPEEEAAPDWRRIGSLLLRFKWVVILMLALGLGAGFAATRVLRPVYRAQANVWVDVPDRRGNGGSDARGPIRQGALLDADAWVELLRSYVVLDQVVRDLRLYLKVKRTSDRATFDAFRVNDTFRPGDYRFSVSADGRQYTLAAAEGVDLERGTLGDSVGNRLGFRWAPPAGGVPPGPPVAVFVVPPRAAPPPPRAEQATDRTAAKESRDPVRRSFFDMAVERDQLRRDRDALERLLAPGGGGDSGLPTEALSAIESVQRAPELSNALKELSDKQAQLRAYRYHYSDVYPPLQRLVAEIAELQQRTIPTLARALSSQLAARQSELGRQVDAASTDLRQIPRRTIEEGRLHRNAQLKEQTYTALQERFDQARLAAEATVPDVRILDPAIVPQRPVKNTGPRLLFMGLLAGLGLGIVGAIVLDRADPKVRYPEQVSRDLGLPILGAVPHLRAKEPAEVVEALRGVRLNLIHTYGSAPLLVTVTSPGPGDGKSFLSANLALTLAEGGHRTLLVDGDIRRGVLHRRVH